MTARWAWHGGGLEAARAHFGDAKEPWIDLSTGINPHAWPGADSVRIDWRRLPEEAGLRALEHSAADYLGADPRHVCAVPGTEIGLRLVGHILPGSARHLARSYRTHGEMFANSASVTPSQLDRIANETLIVANPNNPDGTRHDRALLRGRPGWTLVDEAFADVDPDMTLAPEIGDDHRLLVFRSFGKFFGLAGVRLGFVLGPEPIVGRLRAKLGAWPVSAAAITIGTAAYRDTTWIAAMRERLPREAATLDAVLRQHGYRPRGACPLFRLIETEDAGALFDRLARRAILTRRFDYDPRWLRIGLPGDGAALDRLDAALGDG
jgi:cobalamin biosynthetic protein CobC